ncbi:MAG: hypothetical protein GY710_18370 [Desulfobacteraceae bacterium]|nr:hypothetical protein [Desulfobacteraceae bacterium]
MNLGQILQMADSAFPVGGYAFSGGLEAAARMGMIQTRSDFQQFIVMSCLQNLQSEFPFALSAFQILETKVKPFFQKKKDGQLVDMIWELDAATFIPQMNKASITIGRAWLDICVEISDDKELCRWKAKLLKEKIPLHYAVIFGMTCLRFALSAPQMQELYIYILQRDMISSGVRLGLLGPGEGARTLKLLLTEPYYSLDEIKPYGQAYRTAPLIEIAQAYHNQLYTRLFQN